MTTSGASTVELPKRWPWLFRGFCKYARKYFAKHFHAVRIAKFGPQPSTLDGPVIIVMNHPSWWDAMFGFLLCPQWPDRIDFAPMDAQQLNRYRFFSRLGMYGVEQDSISGARNFLHTSRAILQNDNATIWITAQGAFTDVRTRPVTLRPGVGHLAASLKRGLIYPVAVEYPFWNESKPEAILAFGQPIDIASHSELDSKSWTEKIAGELESVQNQLAVEVLTRDPDRFGTLVSGRAGVGGFYDIGRRMKAWMTGRRFRAEHSEPVGLR